MGCEQVNLNLTPLYSVNLSGFKPQALTILLKLSTSPLFGLCYKLAYGFLTSLLTGECCPDYIFMRNGGQLWFECCECGATTVNGNKTCNVMATDGTCCECGATTVNGNTICNVKDDHGTCCPCGTHVDQVNGYRICNVKDGDDTCCPYYFEDGYCCSKNNIICEVWLK